MDAHQLAEFIKARLPEELDAFAFRVAASELFGSASVFISFAKVPKGSKEIDCLNASVNFLMHLTAAGNYRQTDWPAGAQAPLKLSVTLSRSYGIGKNRVTGQAYPIQWRAKTGTLDQVVTHIVKFFTENLTHLISNAPRFQTM